MNNDPNATEPTKLDISSYDNRFSLGNKLARVAWAIVWSTLYRTSPRPCHRWRCLLLRLFGAKTGAGARPYPTTRIWAPWNLTMGDYSCLGDDVNCYNVAPIHIGPHTTVSQYSYLCTATHDTADSHMVLLTSPIVIEGQAWVCADVFVGPGITIHEGAVIGARSSVYKDVPAWKICVGNPATPIKDRVLNQDEAQADTNRSV